MTSIPLRTVVIGILAMSLLCPVTVPASVVDKTLTIQVFGLCDDSGGNCASLGPSGDSFFATEVNKIWNQAGISVGFNFLGQIYSTGFSYINDSVSGDGFDDLASYFHYQSSTIVDMFLVHTIASPYGTVFGEGWGGVGGFVIAMDPVMAYNRIDTIAHELGHNLGLLPPSQGGDAGWHSTGHNNYLMAAGSVRNVPATLADIAPDGLGYDLLPANQITLARQSTLLQTVPEPGSMILSGISFGAVLIFIRLARRRTACPDR